MAQQTQAQLLILLGQPSQSRQSFLDGSKGMVDRSSERNIILLKLVGQLFAKKASKVSLSCCLVINGMEVLDLLDPKGEAIHGSHPASPTFLEVRSEHGLNKALGEAIRRNNQIQAARSSADCYNLVIQLLEASEDRERRMVILDSTRTSKETKKEKDPR